MLCVTHLWSRKAARNCKGYKESQATSWHVLRGYYPDTAEMSDHIQAPEPMQIRSTKTHLRKPIQVINNTTDMLNKLKNYQYGKLTLTDQNEFMKCQMSETKSVSLSS